MKSWRANDGLYEAVATWVETCLVGDGSLFTPGEAIWTPEVVQTAADRIAIDDVSKSGFIPKLHDQVGDLSPDAIQLTAELLFIHYLAEADTGKGAKLKNVGDVLSWLPTPVGIPDHLASAFEGGVATYGAAKAQRDRYVKFLTRFCVEIKELPVPERERILGDPWELRAFEVAIPGSPLMQREALLHMVFPDVFEPVLAPDAKNRICERFENVPGVADAENVDAKLVVIRDALLPVVGDGFHFYMDHVKPVWSEPEGPWKQIVYWVQRLLDDPSFAATENDDKVAVAARLADARAALLADERDWPEKLRQAFGGDMLLVAWQQSAKFKDWLDDQPEEVKAALLNVWGEHDPTHADLEGFVGTIPAGVLSQPGALASILSFLLMARDVHNYPAYRARAADTIVALAGVGQAAADDPVGRYELFVSFLDQLRVRLVAADGRQVDRLSAQGAVWWMMQNDLPDSWTTEDVEALKAFRGGSAPLASVDEAGDVPRKAWLVRGANVDGVNLVPEWVAEGYVSIGWHDAGPIDPSLDMQSMYELLHTAYPDEPPGALRAVAGSVFRFLGRMSPGDLVASLSRDDVYIGLVESDSFEDDSGHPGALRRRKVSWLNATSPASRAAIKADYPSLNKKLRARLTVTDLGEDAATLGGLVGLGAPTTPEVPVEIAVPRATDELAYALFVEREWLDDVIELLVERKQIVFYGPPGTGKTYIAKALADHITGEGGWSRIVQFHPSYSYEDFFEGYRPDTLGDEMVFVLKPGPLRDAVAAALEDRTRPTVLVVDEINRGDTAKIFGELLFLLEYRNEDVQLQYSPDTPFSLPDNLFVIGTMNTSDRSIALVDAALRRRFYFVELAPSEEPVKHVLPRWLEHHGLNSEPADLLAVLNEAIGKHEIAIGPSYFMTKDGSAPNLERVWRHAIAPVLEEHFYGSGRSVRKEFGLEALRKQLAGAEALGAVPAPETTEETQLGADQATEPDADTVSEA